MNKNENAKPWIEGVSTVQVTKPKETFEVAFGKRLRLARKNASVSLIKLGNHLGYTASAVSKWESGQRRPTFETLVLISNYLHVTTDYLLKGDCDCFNNEGSKNNHRN